METATGSSAFQRAIESVEMLPIEDQMLLVEIIRQRLIQHRRAELVAQVAEARAAYQAGDVEDAMDSAEEVIESSRERMDQRTRGVTCPGLNNEAPDLLGGGPGPVGC